MRLFASAIICCVLWPPPAHACSPPRAIESRVILPGDGATNVPTNVRVALRYEGTSSPPELAEVQIQPVGGQPVAVTTQRGLANRFRFLVFVRPTTPLAANTTFQVLTRIPSVPCGSEPCTTSTFSVAASFTTGSGPDTVPPTYAGLAGVTASKQICDSDACCGPDRVISYGFDRGTPTDDVAYAGVNLYRVGSGLVSELSGLSGFELCSGQPTGGGPIGGEFEAPVGTFYAHAVDLAGNEDSNMQLVTVPLSCADVGDGGSGGGCSSSVAPYSGPPLMLLALVLLRRRRRRR